MGVQCRNAHARTGCLHLHHTQEPKCHASTASSNKSLNASSICHATEHSHSHGSDEPRRSSACKHSKASRTLLFTCGYCGVLTSDSSNEIGTAYSASMGTVLPPSASKANLSSLWSTAICGKNLTT
eukprot:5803507-Amphidinium_carterae.1